MVEGGGKEARKQDKPKPKSMVWLAIDYENWLLTCPEAELGGRDGRYGQWPAN